MLRRFLDGISGRSALIGSVITSIMLSALGTGVWVVLIKPILGSVRRAALSVLTLGIDSLKDAVYVSIARGLSDSIDLMLFGVVSGVMCGGLVAAAIRPRRARWSSTIDDDDTPALWRSRAVTLFVMLLCSVFFLGILAAFTYINSARLHFSQSLAIVAPYLDEHQEELVISEFAQVRSSATYREVIRKLDEAATEGAVELPAFVIW